MNNGTIHHPAGRAVILGLGMSGLAAARLLCRQGISFDVVDGRGKKAAVGEAVGWPGDTRIYHDVPPSGRSDYAFALVSPGIPVGHPWLTSLRSRNVPVIPEFEYGVASLPGVRVVAVTGSNGKSSLVKWIADTLVRCGIRAEAAGNYGVPPCALAMANDPPEVLALELSSFQLEQSRQFRAGVSVLLNLAPNHLDRHGRMENYARAKAQLFVHGSDGDVVIAPRDAWAIMRRWVPENVSPIYFGTQRADARCAEGPVLYREGREALDLSGTWWGTPPLPVNAAAALAVFDQFGISDEQIRASAESFVPLPHRLEFAGEHRGVRYVNDSKASTMTALAAALAAGPERKHLIAGGILKENDLNIVKENLAKYAAFVYGIGESGMRLLEAWGEVVPGVYCADMETAVRLAVKQAVPGDVVLLSPGCASFDQYSSYAARGDDFKQRVRDCIREKQDDARIMMGVAE